MEDLSQLLRPLPKLRKWFDIHPCTWHSIFTLFPLAGLLLDLPRIRWQTYQSSSLELVPAYVHYTYGFPPCMNKLWWQHVWNSWGNHIYKKTAIHKPKLAACKLNQENTNEQYLQSSKLNQKQNKKKEKINSLLDKWIQSIFNYQNE